LFGDVGEALEREVDKVVSQTMPEGLTLEQEEVEASFYEAVDRGDLQAAVSHAADYIALWPRDYHGYDLRDYANWSRDNCKEAAVDFGGTIACNRDDQYA